jgi:hypothetical protein
MRQLLRLILAVNLLFLLSSGIILAQERATVSGFVTDSASQETLLGAYIIVKGTTTGTQTNTSGFYSLSGLEPGDYTLQFTYVGFQTVERVVSLTAGERLRLDVSMTESSVSLGEVIVSADAEEREEARNIGTAQVSTALIKQVPAVLQADVFRSIQLLPGVKAASDFSSGLYIRGGGPDQTLILLDRTTVYNPTHFFGLFSTFNPDAIKDVRLYKGGFPAEYGGRLGSVLDIYNKDGNRVERSGVVSLGMLSSRAMIEGPYKRGSYMLAIRRSTIEPVLAVLRNSFDTLPESFYFVDINGKLNFDLNENNRLNVAFYGGEDNVDFPFADDLRFKLRYGNRTISSTWTSIRSEQLFTTFTVTSSNYFNTPRFSIGGTPITRENTVNDISVKSDLEWTPSSIHTVKAGFWAGNLTLKLADSFDNRESFRSRIQTQYLNVYLQDDIQFTPQWSVNAGLRLNYFTKGDYIRLEPRISTEYSPDSWLRLQASYGRYYQFLTLITNEAFSGFDTWLTTDSGVPPSWGDQFVFGAKIYPFQGYNFEFEAYYRDMNSLFELDPRIPDVSGVDYAELFRFGKGYAFGTELVLEKSSGRFNGFVGYTWSVTRRKFEGFNKDNFYPPKYDRTHDFNVVANYRLSSKWKATAVFNFATGQAYTQALGRTEISDPFGTSPGRPIIVGRVNASRLPNYHRLDIGFTREGKFFNLGTSEFQIQIINVYSRRNIWFYQFDLEDNPATRSEVPLLPILPTLTYTVQF